MKEWKVFKTDWNILNVTNISSSNDYGIHYIIAWKEKSIDEPNSKLANYINGLYTE